MEEYAALRRLRAADEAARGDDDDSESEEEDMADDQTEGSDGDELVLDLDAEGRIGGVGSVDYSLRIVDGLLSARAVVAARREVLRVSALDVGAACGGADVEEDGETAADGALDASFWLPAGAAPRGRLEAIADAVFRRHTAGATFDAARSGAEWCVCGGP